MPSKSDSGSAVVDDPSGHTQSSPIVHRDRGTDDKNALEVEVVDLIAFLEEIDRDIRILKTGIEGAEWDILNGLIDHPVLSRVGCIFVETHERQDLRKYVPMFEALQERAEQIKRPYINLYWV
ncbi:MAG: FkbM family methyltransferase [Paracoccaceae bacterium]